MRFGSVGQACWVLAGRSWSGLEPLVGQGLVSLGGLGWVRSVVISCGTAWWVKAVLVGTAGHGTVGLGQAVKLTAMRGDRYGWFSKERTSKNY